MKTTENKGRVLETHVQRSIGESVVTIDISKFVAKKVTR